MVVRKQLPRGAQAAADGAVQNDFAGSDVPAILRPGQNPTSNTSTPISYSNFEAEEESVWRQPPQPSAKLQPPAQANIPTIMLQTATGSSAGSAFSDSNPFKRKILAAGSAEGNTASSSSPSGPPRPPPPVLPTEGIAELSVDDQTQNPWQPGAPVPSRLVADTTAAVVTGTVGENAWASPNPSEQPSRRPSPGASNARRSNLISFSPEDEGDNAGWDEVPPHTGAPGTGAATGVPPPRPPFTPIGGREGATTDSAVFEDSHAWDDLGTEAARGVSSQPKPLPADLVTEEAGEGWNIVNNEPAPGQLSRQSTWENFTDDEDEPNRNKNGITPKRKAKGKAVVPPVPASSADPEDSAPNAVEPLISIDSPPPSATVIQALGGEEAPAPRLPPRSMLDIGEEAPPKQPPRPVQAIKAETYQIKNIAWFDFRSGQNPRISPILMQNANGPCPLVALVNALTLTTPAESTTVLIETLRTREQVSLSLLLDAVFDELMSSRRSSDGNSLPDVSELYKFLKGLHTGMNVNPRFIPTPDVLTAFRRTSLTHLHPAERDDMIPGTFEETREMQLYSTFNVPLIHGWLPSKEDAVYEALARQAASYEDVQNLLFREEELEDKLSSPTGEGLTEDEQGLYQDILEIKTFLYVSATQLTPFGLDVVAKAMMPGSFAILFRNDHFSTLYRHPQTLQLLSLVTDAGYANHDEVIWETLVDVNGEHAEFYSGDFRLVGGNIQQEQLRKGQDSGAEASGSGSGGTSSSSQGGWTAVRGRRQKASSSPEELRDHLSVEELARHEQEDRDLALALQLQEEEEERHRAAEVLRNNRLSEQFIEQSARQSVQGANGSRRPSNAAGGGRYAQQSPVSPRRSSAGVSPNSNISVDNSGRRSSATSYSASGNGSSLSVNQRGPYRDRTSPTQQVVRPLVPPATNVRIVNPRPAVHRPPDQVDGEAPPSYEQAAQQAPYHPPPGAPGSDISLSQSTTGRSSSSAATSANAGPSPRPSRANMPPNSRPFVTPGSYPQQAYRPQQMAASRNDRDCTIM